jgi:hypothetical protein
VIDNRGPCCRPSAIRGRKEIAGNNFHFVFGIEFSERFFKAAKSAGGPNETTDIGKTVVKKRLDYFTSDKATGSAD